MIDRIFPGYAAIDLHNEKHFVAVAGQPVRSFGTFTRDLRAMAGYLSAHKVTRVAMEATGVLWVQPHDVLQAAGFEVTLFHPAHARNLPGRKTDVQDCQWHAMLHSHGLLRPCFVPPEPIRKLRAYCRLRDDHLAEAASHILHMQRSLDLMNVRVHNVISQLQGVSGLRMVEAILAGERDPVALASLCDRSLKAKEAEIIASLEGDWQDHHLFALRQALEAYRFCQQQVGACDQEIQKQLDAINTGRAPSVAAKGTKVKITRHNRPQIDNLYGRLLTACGGKDAQQLSGIAPLGWLKLVGEVGTQLDYWKTGEHFANWVGHAPLRNRSGKREWRLPRRKTRAGQIFREAAMSLTKSKHCALGAFYRRIRGRRGAAVAIVATARKLAVLYWQIMVHGLEYVERGVEAYQKQMLDQQERYLRRKARQLGFKLTPASPTVF